MKMTSLIQKTTSLRAKVNHDKLGITRGKIYYLSPLVDVAVFTNDQGSLKTIDKDIIWILFCLKNIWEFSL